MRGATSSVRKGVACILLSAFGFALMAMFVRLADGCGGSPLPAPQKAFFRNIVAAAILSLAPHVPVLMAPDARFIASGIIDERKDEVLAGLRAAGLTPVEVKEKRGWVCIICKKSETKEA